MARTIRDWEQTRDLAASVLSDPSVFPAEFKAWVREYPALDPVPIPASSVVGIQPQRVTTTQFAALAPGSSEMEVLLEVDSTLGIYWHLRYHPASSSSYKWEFLGGTPLHANVETQETVTSTTYVDAATAGPSVTAPRAGDYLVHFNAEMAIAHSGTGQAWAYSSPKLGGAATADADSVLEQSLGNAAGLSQYGVNARTLKKTLAANDVVKVQYRAGTANVTLLVAKRALVVTPIRIS